MAKLVFFAVFLAALVAVSLAQGSAAAQCKRELQERSFDACGQALQRRMAGTRAQVQSCCKQLQNISRRECRCAAIRLMVRSYEQQQTEFDRAKLMKATRYAAQLPVICGVDAQQCDILATGQF